MILWVRTATFIPNNSASPPRPKLVPAMRPPAPSRKPKPPAHPPGHQWCSGEVGDLEKQHILATLAQCEGNRTRTAEVLDINIRTLRNKLNEYKEAGESVD